MEEVRAHTGRERGRPLSAPERRPRREANRLRMEEKFTVQSAPPLIARCHLWHHAARPSPSPPAGGRGRQSREFPFGRRLPLSCVRRAPLSLLLCRQKAQMQ
jgi:hypothetical protein